MSKISSSTVTESASSVVKRASKRTAAQSDAASTSTVSGNSIHLATSSASMVTVGLNHPHGIRFPLDEKREVHIRGNAEGLRYQEKGIIPVGRYGYTRISLEEWTQLEKLYGNTQIFKNGLIFAELNSGSGSELNSDGKSRAEDRAREQAELRHGLEPIDPHAAFTEEAGAEAEGLRSRAV